MPAIASSKPKPTRQRLLEAASRICAERGLHGATTREIAEAAEVNEVTLFRHFGSKEKLIAALFAQSVAAQTEALSETEPDVNDLESDLLRYARRFSRMLFAHEPLIRTLIGEAHRQPEAARQVISDSVKPIRQRLRDYLRAAQKIGSVRADLKVAPAVDAFTGMLLAGMLRRTGTPKCLDYSQDAFVTTCAELFLHGIAAPQPARRP